MPTPPDDLETSLKRAAHRHGPPPSAPGPSQGVAEALAQFSELAKDDAPPPVRPYRPAEVGVVLTVLAAVVLLFDSEGLLTWARRLDVGPLQRGVLLLLEPVHEGLQLAHLGAPRQALNGATQALTTALGGEADPLLAFGWGTAAPAPTSDELDLIAPLEPLDAEAADLGAVAALEAAAPEPVPVVVPTLDDDVLAPLDPTPRGLGVLLLGDSLMGGSLGRELVRGLGRDGSLRVEHAFQTATGLSRPEIYDWMKVVPPLLERERPGLVVVSLGANDATPVRLGEAEVKFGSPEWGRAYFQRVVAMMRLLTKDQARVLWLGLPPMRDARFSAHARYLNGLFARAAKRVPGVEFLEVRMLVSDATGDYATLVRAPDGHLARYRLEDGIHYAPAGARAIAAWIYDWVRERRRAVRAG